MFRKYLMIFIAICLAFAVNINGQAGQGKLAGKILDAETGEALIGANVILLGTNSGAAADANGEYFILNITPGTYDVKVSYVGYSSKTIQQVRIVGGVTYELNIELSSGIEIDEIVVEDKKVFEPKATNTVKVVDTEDIQKLPVTGVGNIASLQSGVVKAEGSGGVDGNATLNVRGGRGNEVLYIVDGIPQNSIYDGGNASQVSDHAIEQLSFQVGGYEAKFGQAQSGIISVTTKAGQSKYRLFADVKSSSFTDDYGYNQYTASISGPIIPGISDHTFFLSAERGWFADSDPSAISINLESIGKTYDSKPNNSSGINRFTARTNHNLGDFQLKLGASYNDRKRQAYVHYNVKNNSMHNPMIEEDNFTASARISQTVNSNTFWNLTLGYRNYYYNQYDPRLGDNLLAYGDGLYLYENFGITKFDGSALDPGTRQVTDGPEGSTNRYGVFSDYGRVWGSYIKEEQDNFNAQFEFTTQYENHLFELGGSFNYTILRYYAISAYSLASIYYEKVFDFEYEVNDVTMEEVYDQVQPTVFGYDLMGKEYTDVGSGAFQPKTPIVASAYIQDRYELEDLVINLGVRMDYFDTRADVLKDPSLPFGEDGETIDPEDLEEKEAQIEFSPRIGFGFPVTESTVFHAQYGRFIQLAPLNDLYNGPYDLKVFEQMDPQYVRTGSIVAEETIQYELGFRQMVSDNVSLNITAFYKNIKGLVNRVSKTWQSTATSPIRTYIAPNNSDFGTTKGFAFSLDVTRLSNFDISAQYTFSIAEGTGSSTSSSQTAVFRNTNNEAPKVIAPLDFDQRHTGVINVNYYVPKGEGWLEMLNINALFSFSSGRPYTPVDKWDIISSATGGIKTVGYVNSRYAPGSSKIDLRIEKSFEFGDIKISPYLWVENLLDSDNIVSVWRSTGSASTTGWLLTEEGRTEASETGTGEIYAMDYQTRENDPSNYGIPRLIKLGLRVNFSNISF